eukprot:NODE_6521_length_840_cov_118.866109_g6285_i0.p1 GENE.NODE_6521_length_840_cov_118.866109_g6285_i0~~NODE_6521_length_840_cov_118.866109_g6285_i0.p1  ORF type:complete len:257 (-),score=64.53 NODE_6521_length_840_cov_118.866109_g6285_i0:69-755(-)
MSAVVEAQFSLGDRLVLEHEYNKSYSNLPLTASEAHAQGWDLDSKCVNGYGRKATHRKTNQTLSLYYTNRGEIFGYGAHLSGIYGIPYQPHPTEFASDIALIFRDPKVACTGERDVVRSNVTSIGDRLLVATYENDPLALTASEASSKFYVKTPSCFPHMGHHYITPFPLALTSPIMTMYLEKTGEINGVLISSALKQNMPPFEWFTAFKIHSLHLYFKEHVNACVTN